MFDLNYTEVSLIGFNKSMEISKNSQTKIHCSTRVFLDPDIQSITTEVNIM